MSRRCAAAVRRPLAGRKARVCCVFVACAIAVARRQSPVDAASRPQCGGERTRAMFVKRRARIEATNGRRSLARARERAAS